MDGIRTGHARCVLGVCALIATLIASGSASAGTRRYGGFLGGASAKSVLGSGFAFQSRHDPSLAATAQGSGQLTYHGGPVMRTDRVYAIYWVPPGYSVSAAYRTSIDGFFANVAADSRTRGNVYSINTEYGDSTGPIAYSSTFAGSTLDTQPFPASGCTSVYSTCLNNSQLAAEIARVATQNDWSRGLGSIFFVFTPRNVSSCWDSGGTLCFVRQYCAYHSWYQDAGGLILFANMPYAASDSTCGGGWLSSPHHDDADATINVTSHEHNETITDPLGNGWYDNAGYENGDKCAWDFGTQLGGSPGAYFNQRIGSGTYELQQEYSNAASGCLLRPAAAAPAPVPTVTGFSPASAAPGASVTIAGSGFSGASAVTFAGSSATFSVRSDTSIVATVPAAAGSGKISVTTPGGTATSAGTFAVIRPTLPANTSPPSITGTPKVGQVFTAGPGTWTGTAPIAYQYAWQRCTVAVCTFIAGAASSKYTAATADAGYALRVVVTASNAVGRTTASSAPTAVIVVPPPTNTVAPAISGTPRVWQTLTAGPGTWTGLGPIGYELIWQRCKTSCTTIAYGWGSRYTVVPLDRGFKLRVVVTATNPAGRTTAYSAQTATIT